MTELIPKYDTRKSFYGKAIVENSHDGFYLYSYGIEVFMIPYEETEPMKLLWRGYSLTTYRHIIEFIYQYGLYGQIKDISTKITKKEIESFYNGGKEYD